MSEEQLSEDDILNRVESVVWNAHYGQGLSEGHARSAVANIAWLRRRIAKLTQTRGEWEQERAIAIDGVMAQRDEARAQFAEARAEVATLHNLLADIHEMEEAGDYGDAILDATERYYVARGLRQTEASANKEAAGDGTNEPRGGGNAD